MLPIGAVQKQLRTRLVGQHDEAEVLHDHLAGAATSAVCVTSGLRFAPRPAFQLDLVFVRLVLRFALDTLDLQEIVNLCHGIPLAGWFLIEASTGPARPL